MARRTFPASYKVLMHFDYPYFAEPGDGCRDEIGNETWTRAGAVKFVGTEAPNEGVVEGTPLFDSYRCPQFAGAADYLSGTNSTGMWNLSSSGSYEIEFFVRPTAATAGNILALMNGSTTILTLSLDTSRRVVFACSSWGANATSSAALTLSAWTHVLLRVSGGNATVYVAGALQQTVNLTANATLTVTEARLGGYVGQMDEFLFKASAGLSAPTVPTAPYQGTVSVSSVGGFGNGSHGDETITRQNEQINTYAMIQSIADERTFTVGARNIGKYGDFTPGDEVMLHVSLKKGTQETELGKYSLRRISSITGSTITLDKAPDVAVDGFTLDASLIASYYVQVLSVPNYKSLSVPANTSIVPLKWNTTNGGGVVALKCKENLTVQGMILSSGYMAQRNDLQQFTHSDLPDRLPLGSGGGVFIVADKVSASEAARLGATWDGSTKRGVAALKKNGTPGGAGYGGAGGSDFDSNSLAGHGAVGGGGGSNNGNTNTNDQADNCSPGKNPNTTGGYGRSYASSSSSGGTQGKTAGAVGGVYNPGSGYQSSAGGGAGGDGGTRWTAAGGYAGSTLVLICRALSASAASISTGGGVAPTVRSDAPGDAGGGTGFAYIACREMGAA